MTKCKKLATDYVYSPKKQQCAHVMQTVQLHRHDPYIVQLQAQCILYPNGAQMRPVRTNHM